MSRTSTPSGGSLRRRATDDTRFTAVHGARFDHASRADLTLTHRLFLLRDDALFLKCLEYCWFLDPWKRVPSETDYRRSFGAADTESES